MRALAVPNPEHRTKPAGFVTLWAALTMPCVALYAAEPELGSAGIRPKESVGVATNGSLQAALQKLSFPGVAIDVQEWCVDVQGSVCLHRGELELVACTKGTKEHESILAIQAKPMHVHAALLLLGAQPGSPATRQAVGDPTGRWVEIPPSGGAVDVSLVLRGVDGKLVERRISDFIAPSGRRSEDPARADQGGKFPTHTFLFAGSVLSGDGPGPRRYECDESGNVISLSTFGDELLCLPAIHSHDNGALLWEVNATHLPSVGSNITLRLRPRLGPGAKSPQAHQSPAGTVPP